MLRNKSTKNKYVKCPNCGIRGIDVPPDSEVGDGVFCEMCDCEYVLVSLNPVKIEPSNPDDYYYEDENDDVDEDDY